MGCGVDISKLSPRGAKINNTANETSGAVSFMELYSTVTGLIGQNGRRGALMISIDCNHPDLEEFIELKSDLGKVNTANISIRVTDNFMQSVVNREDYTLSYTREETGEKITKVVNAYDLFMKFCEMNWDYGEPAMLFWDEIENHNFLSEFEDFKFAGTNPCLTGDTLIQTVEGNISIKELIGKTPYVYAMGDNGDLTIKKASKVWLTRKDAIVVKVVTGKGTITCTPDHRIFTTNRGWVEAQYLTKGDKIKGLNRQTTGHKYCSVGLSGTKYEKEHRFVLRHFMDIDGKDVHHINDDGFDNRLSNLGILCHDEHSALSNMGRKIEPNRDITGKFIEKSEKTQRKTKNLGKQIGVNWYVKDVIRMKQTEDVYDMTVPEVHNFIANDMVVHNCAEEPLPAGGSCLLGSINLAEFVGYEDYYPSDPCFKFDEFEEAVRTATIALNELMDEGLPLHPLQEQRDSVRDWRQIGLGIMGLADMLIKMEIEYGSDEALELCDSIGAYMLNSAVMASTELASEQGAFPKYRYTAFQDSDMFDLLSDCTKGEVWINGVRNSQFLTIAPTGTLSTMLGISGGIEPIYANYYTRTTKSLFGEDVTYKVYTPIVEQYMKKHGLTDESELPEFFVTAQTLDSASRIMMQSTWQTYIDASISSTVNLPNSATVQDVADIYLNAWRNGIKGITVFRDGCKRTGILNIEKEEKVAHTGENDLEWGTVLEVNDDVIGKKRKLMTGCGTLHVSAFFDPDGNLVETYLSKGSSGGCNNYMTALSRMVSLSARAGVGIDAILDQLKSSGTCPSYAVRTAVKKDTSQGSCCPMALAFALKEMYLEMQDELGLLETYDEKPYKAINPCPSCGGELKFEGGCNSCPSCGWSKCD